MSNKSTTLNVSGDLSLASIDFPKFSKNVIVSEELNAYLRDQLQQTKRENHTLHEELARKESQIEQNQRKIDKLNEKLHDFENCCSNDFASASQVANSKIVELSKKLREKNSEIEVYKSKCIKLENTLSELKLKQEDTVQIDKPVETDLDETKKLQEKLNYTTNKWIEEKNLNLQLKNDLKRANKWLQQEVGDKFETLLSLNNSSNSNWRGRAQIICDLQQKNQELKEKLKQFQDNKSPHLNTEALQVKHERKIEALKEENSNLKNNYTDLKRKFDTLKTRCKVLEGDQSFLKSKLASLTERHDADQQTVVKLTSQLQQCNHLKTDDLRQKDQLVKHLQQEIESLKVELMKEKCLSENKSKELLEKSDDIQLLNKRIRSSRPPSSYKNRHENLESKTINRLEVERLRLLELSQVQNDRLEMERNAHLKSQHLLRAEKQKCARLEASLARLELEQSSAKIGYANKNMTPKRFENDIKDKLELAEENIKALTTRLEIESMERKRDFQEFSKILKDCTCGKF
ncbi:Coiled-coil domain-containing protein 13-like Protein [Tribolium castaneum]|uniref:Coiled-coil domain-containing protein 13-like Protein n=2 Tax=Tribolium castaneum TaxID=7070 RepID=D6WRW4_TRICA|nr:PREDICTED: putative leucine-rich repeat-containing protein DDB_G0290503 [Tribolium castaneum]EFA06429.1 Coiled-coil domain-containing protein 13-like Protein [Tribolium castaneum]|eukprot:XP_015836659.1 PREDICTED: putative leucine-rich repeat-containing protein DDB_G0290503 [Tribolium castaneum]